MRRMLYSCRHADVTGPPRCPIFYRSTLTQRAQFEARDVAKADDEPHDDERDRVGDPQVVR